MEISFVIPAHNEQHHIGRSLEALIEQIKISKVEAEIIVVDNASTDRTGAIAGSFANVTVVKEPRKGLSQARQTGYQAATGELIANIDADTIMPDGWIEQVVTEFAADPKLVALSGPHIYYDLPMWQRLLVRVFYYLGYAAYLINRTLVQGGNFVLRKSALDKVGGFNTDFSFYGEDTEVARRMHQVGRVKFTFKLPMYTSGRRIAKEGLLTMGARYSLNYFWTTFFKRPFSTTNIDVRIEKPNK